VWKGPECNSDIRDRGLRQQLFGRMRISDLCGRQPLYIWGRRGQPRMALMGGAQDSNHTWEVE
jgi:hypothetical protein